MSPAKVYLNSFPICIANPCESTPCKNGGKCKNKGNDFQCECSENYEGDTCESIGWYNIL